MNNKKVNPSTKLYQDGQPKIYCPFCGEKLDKQTNPNNCWNCQAPISKHRKIYKWLMQRLTKSNFTKTLTILIWIAMTGWAITSFNTDWPLLIILAVIWIFFIPAYHLIEDVVG